MKTDGKKFQVQIEEYERGWGSKIDELKGFDKMEDANDFIKEYNKKHNTTEVAPDWYMVASPYNYTYTEIKPKPTVSKSQCLLMGEKFDYDASSRSKLEHAKIVFDDMFDYMGSSMTWFSDGVEHKSEELIHFFKRK